MSIILPVVLLPLKKGINGHKGNTPEQVISKLRDAEIFLEQGTIIAAVSKKIWFSSHTCYRWRRGYGGMVVDQAHWLRPKHRDRVWSYFFMIARTADGVFFSDS